MATFTDSGILEQCDQCDGKGQVDGEACPQCGGMGDVQNCRPWRVNISLGTVERIESELDCDLLEADEIKKLFQAEEVELMVDILWECCKEQADLRDIGPEQFAERLGGDAISDAHDALVEELKGFFTVRGAAPLASAIDRMRAMMVKTNQRAEKALDEVDLTDADLDALMDKVKQQAMNEKEKVLHGDESGK